MVFLRFLTLLVLIVAGIGQVASQEHIILSGGPALRKWENLRVEADRHDRVWLNFIRPARYRMVELRKLYGPNAQITWLVHRDSYQRRAREDGKPVVRWVESVRDKYKVRLVWFRKGDQVIDYLNRGQNRSRVKVRTFDFYGHSNKHAMMFDYSNHISGASKSFIHEDDLAKIRRGIFSKDCQLKSWGCHTGESMSKVWYKATGTRLWGAIGKTDYRKISTLGRPVLSSGARWAQ